jgi:hypothetical protein
MKPTALIMSLLLIGAMFGCLKKATPGPDTKIQPTQTFTFTPSKNPVTTPVTGKWRWVSTYASEGGLYTPASTHSVRYLEFDTDSTVREISNDTLMQHKNYTYVNSYTFMDSSSGPAVYMGQTWYQVFIKNDTLNFNLIEIDPSFGKYVPAN